MKTERNTKRKRDFFFKQRLKAQKRKYYLEESIVLRTFAAYETECIMFGAVLCRGAYRSGTGVEGRVVSIYGTRRAEWSGEGCELSDDWKDRKRWHHQECELYDGGEDHVGWHHQEQQLHDDWEGGKRWNGEKPELYVYGKGEV